MKDFFLSLMTDRRTGAAWVPLKCALYVLSLVYGAAIIGRRLLYALRVFRSEKVPMRIVSIGNLTLGGTGKTPFVIALAGIVRNELKRDPCVLIRGYGWDETAMLKKSLPDTPILAGEDRVKQAHRAIKLYGSSIGILDDGFQYWEMRRDLDVVLVDSSDPFGNGRLFPRGVLREPKAALKRADIVVFTKTDKGQAILDALKADLKRVNSSLVFLEAVHRPVHFYDQKERKALPLSAAKEKRVVLISGIGDPSYFAETVKGLGATVAEHMIFADHHEYSARDIERARKRCDERAFDYIITTEKDAVKLARKSLYFGKYKLLVLAIEMEITSGKEILVDRLRSLHRG
jgi:tetraacyldisaccharide 4'-kinase